MARGHPFSQAVWATRVVADVAADRAALLAARIGREVKAVVRFEPCDGTGEIEVQHPWSNPGSSIARVDRLDGIHANHADHARIIGRCRSPGETGSCSANDKGPSVLGTDANDTNDFVGGIRKTNDAGRADHVGRIVRIESDLHPSGLHLVVAQGTTK